jgi:dTMP kinase
MTEAAAPRTGYFISFEGTEGSGKTTQMHLLVDRLRELGYPVVLNQEPGATIIGKEIRRILLDPSHAEMNGMTELLLMFASRAQAAAEIIRPALKSGSVVVSDRFTDSTLAYQGSARQLGFERVLAAHDLALGSLKPDLTICVALDLETGLRRARERNRNKENGTSEERIDQQSMEFHRRVWDGYSEIARLEPGRFRMIDGSGSVPEVADRIWSVVQPELSIIKHRKS